MNRIEIIGMFAALKALHEAGEHEKVGKVIDEVLNEARSKNTDYKETNII